MRFIKDSEAAQAVSAYVEAKRAAEAAAEQLAKAQHELVELLASREQKSIQSDVNGLRMQVTVASAERVRYDEAALKKALGARTFNAVSKRVLDRGRLDQAVAEGKVDITVVAQYATITKSAPYVTLRRVSVED